MNASYSILINTSHFTDIKAGQTDTMRLLSFIYFQRKDIIASTATTFALIQQYLTVGLGVLLVVGDNILNFSVFLRKRLSSNVCSAFFAATAASIANIIVLIYYIIPTIYSAYNPAPENSHLVYCKLRLYIRNALLVISRTYLTMACVSCYAQSSRKTANV
jgi:hypothetical protein